MTDSISLWKSICFDMQILWEAACGGNIRLIKSCYEVDKSIVNKRYPAFGTEHSLIMGALRNNEFKTVDFLISVGGTITEAEREEMSIEVRRMRYMDYLVNRSGCF